MTRVSGVVRTPHSAPIASAPSGFFHLGKLGVGSWQERSIDVSVGRSSVRRSKEVVLARSMTVDDAVALIFTECLKHWTSNEAVALKGADPEGIHEMRVGLRRMRAALSDFRAIIPLPQLAWMKRETKWLITSLGAARDWDVFLTELLEPVEAARPQDRELRELRSAARAERKRGYATTHIAIRCFRHSRFLAQMRDWLSTRRWCQSRQKDRGSLDEPIQKLALRVLRKRHAAALKLGRDFSKLSAKQRHQLRIALKKLRYTADFFRSLYPKKHAKPYFHALAQMQNCLGHMNDVVVAKHLLERMTSVHQRQRVFAHLLTATGTVIGWHARGASAAAQEAQENWRTVREVGCFW
jgi:triphosphatase